MVKVREDRSVRTRACYLAIGVTVEGDREVLGIWWQETEGSKFWLAVLNDLHHRGVQDVLVACVDGLTGFPEAIEAVFPQAWVQTCIVHQIRASMRFVTYQDRKRVAADLKPVYRAVNADAAADALEAFDKVWGARPRCPRARGGRPGGRPSTSGPQPGGSHRVGICVPQRYSSPHASRKSTTRSRGRSTAPRHRQPALSTPQPRRAANASSPSTHASMRSPLHANDAGPLTPCASSIATCNPQRPSTSCTKRAPFIDSRAAHTARAP
jgi:Transposase, Mutator family